MDGLSGIGRFCGLLNNSVAKQHVLSPLALLSKSSCKTVCYMNRQNFYYSRQRRWSQNEGNARRQFFLPPRHKIFGDRVAVHAFQDVITDSLSNLSKFAEDRYVLDGQSALPTVPGDSEDSPAQTAFIMWDFLWYLLATGSRRRICSERNDDFLLPWPL